MSIKECKTDPSSTKESADAGVNEIQIEINDSSSSHNNNFAISLKSKNVDVDFHYHICHLQGDACLSAKGVSKFIIMFKLIRKI